MKQQASTFDAIFGLVCTGIGLAALIFTVWAWAMNDDFKQLPEYHYYQHPSSLCTDAKVVRNGAYYELEITDCVGN